MDNARTIDALSRMADVVQGEADRREPGALRGYFDGKAEGLRLAIRYLEVAERYGS